MREGTFKYDSLTAALCYFSRNAWKRRVRRALHSSAFVRDQPHRVLARVNDEAPGLLTNAAPVTAMFACAECAFSSETWQGLRSHLARCHDKLHVSVLLAGTSGTTCPGCLRVQHTRQRLIKHLKRSKKCERIVAYHLLQQRILETLGFSVEPGECGGDLARANDKYFEQSLGPLLRHPPAAFELGSRISRLATLWESLMQSSASSLTSAGLRSNRAWPSPPPSATSHVSAPIPTRGCPRSPGPCSTLL